MAATLITCPQCVVYKEQLDAKTAEIKVLQERNEELEHKLEDMSREKEAVRERLNDKLMQLNDSAIKVRILEEQLQSALDRSAIGELSRAEVDGIISRDLERIHSQLVQKDMKIMELNNTILEKERHILDLQEMCREQGELVQAKAKAFYIIQQKLQDLDSRSTREDSTETEASYLFETPSSSSYSTSLHPQKDRRLQRDSTSPGHAVVHFKMGTSGSPPPIDPSEERSSITLETGTLQDDVDTDDPGGTSGFQKKKHRKKVTFDLPPPKELKNGIGQEVDDDIAQAIIDLTTENDQLRQTIQEMECSANDAHSRVSQLQTQLDELSRDGRNQVLKARAAMQGRIRDLEDKIASLNAEHTEKVEHLNASIDTLRADREWTLEENARLLKLLSSYKEKLNDTWEALDARQTECDKLRCKLDDDRALIVRLADDLEEAQQTANALLEQKISILDDVGRLKEALEAQDEYIELLEADTVIYEEHIGLLRDSLGASKVERRALIKSKAFEAKLKALEQEKEQMSRRSNDEKLHIKALHLKVSSLEAENAVLIARNDELESRLAQLGGELSTFTAAAPSATETAPDSAIPGSAFRPVHAQAATQEGTSTETRASIESVQWLEPGSVAGARVGQNRYDEEKLLSEMQKELDVVRGECSVAQEKIVQLGCVNFELENQLKDAKEELKNVENRAEQAEQQAAEARQNCVQQEKRQQSLEAEFAAKLSAMELKMNELKDKLALKNEQLEAATIENSKRDEEMKQWRFAVDEVEAVHMELQMLEKQLNDEKAAMESKWAEVRTVLLEREGDMSRKTSNAESVVSGEQNTANQIRQLMDTISDLKSTVNEQTKRLEREKADRRKFKAAIRQLQADKETLQATSVVKASDEDEQQIQQYRMQVAGLQRQRDFMDHEMTRLCALNNSKDDLIRKLQIRLGDLNPEKSGLQDLAAPESDESMVGDDRIRHLEGQMEMAIQEKGEISNLLEKRTVALEETQMYAHRLEMEYQQLQLQLQSSAGQNQKQETVDASAGADAHQYAQQQQHVEVSDSEMVNLLMAAPSGTEESASMEMRTQMERLTLALQQEDTELKKIMDENAALKIRCDELTAALHSVNGEMERRSQEKDDIIEMLQSQHTYLSQTILQNEKREKQLERTPTVSQTVNLKESAERVMVQDASTCTEQVVAIDSTPVMLHSEIQAEANSAETSHSFGFETAESESVVHLSEITETTQEPSSEVSRTAALANDLALESENLLLRQCVNESSRMQDNLTDDIKQLMVLNAELETAVEVLKGEIWTLNGQLKASLTDREDLSDKLCELSQRHEEEIVRARERERDLEEQKDMAEKSQRQAALAENESNRRLVEWQEKSAEMERSRLELENAYAQLSEYYQQLQEAYNALYARVHAYKIDSSAQTIVDSSALEHAQEIAEKVELLKNELEQRKLELDGRAAELRQLQELLKQHLCAALRNIKDLREMNLQLLKDFIAESVQTIRAQLQEASDEVRARAEETITKWIQEKELKDAEITTAIQQLLNGVLAESDFPRTQELSLSSVVDAVNKEFAEKESENAGLKKDLRDERNDKVALEMRMRQAVSEKDEESAVKVRELEDLLQSTQLSLTEHIARCQLLQAKLDELGSATASSSTEAAECGTSGGDPWKCSTPCTICRELKQIKQPPPTSQLQLAILAARLTTKIADNDALFRCNAELAQTNLRLQNEIDEMKERIAQLSDIGGAPGIIDTTQSPLQSYPQVENQPSQQEQEESEEQEWTWGAEEEDECEEKIDASNPVFHGIDREPSRDQEVNNTSETSENQVRGPEKEMKSSDQQIESQKRIIENLERKCLELKEKGEKLESNVEKLEKELEASEEYCSELETKLEQLETDLEKSQRQVAGRQQQLQEVLEDEKLKMNQTIDPGELTLLRSQNEQLTDTVERLNHELLSLSADLASTKQLYESKKANCEFLERSLSKEMDKQKDTEVLKPEEREEELLETEGDWDWSNASEQFQLPSAEPVEGLHDGISNPHSKQVENLVKRVELIGKSIQTETENEAEKDRMQVLQELKEKLREKEVQMQELEKENKSLCEKLQYQQQLIEGLEKKLDMTEEYSVELEAKNANMEQEIMEHKKKYEHLLAEKSFSAEKAESEAVTKLEEELIVVKQENDSLTAQLAEKQASVEQEKTEMQAELTNLEQLLIDRKNALKNLKKKLQHTVDENTQLQRQLEDYSSQMDELRIVSGGVDRELQKMLDEAQKEVTELKQKVDEVGQQNELLKDSEQRLMDALDTSNEEMARLESENANMKSEIVNLQTELLKSEEMIANTDYSEKPATKSTSTMTDMDEETGRRSTVVLSTTVDNKDYSQMQKKVDELKQKFKEAVRDKALAEERAEAMQKELSVSKKKKKHGSASQRTTTVPSAVPSASVAVTREGNETSDVASSGRFREGSHASEEPLEPAVQRTVQRLQQVCLEHHDGIDELGELSEKLKECGVAIREKLLLFLIPERKSSVDASLQAEALMTVLDASVATDPEKSLGFGNRDCADMCVQVGDTIETISIAVGTEESRVFVSRAVGVDQGISHTDGWSQVTSTTMLDKSVSFPEEAKEFSAKSVGTAQVMVNSNCQTDCLLEVVQKEFASVAVKKEEVTVPENMISADFTCQTEGLVTMVNKEVLVPEISKQFESRAIQTEVQRNSTESSCQVEDLVIAVDEGVSRLKNPVELSLVTVCNEVLVSRESIRTDAVDFCCQIESSGTAKEMKNICIENEKLTADVSCQVEGLLSSGEIDPENPRSLSVSLQTELYDEHREAASQTEALFTLSADCPSEMDGNSRGEIGNEYRKLVDCCIQTEFPDDLVDVASLQYIAATLLHLQQIIRLEIEKGELRNNDYIEQFEQNISVFVAYLNRIMQKTEQNSATESEIPQQPQLIQNLSDESLVLGTDAHNLGAEIPLDAATAVLVPGYLSSIQNVPPNLHGWLMAQAQEPQHTDEQVLGQICTSALEPLTVQQVGLVNSTYGNEDGGEYIGSKSDEIIISQLQNDNVRLEEELLRAHNKIECLEAELKRRMRKLQTLECDLRETKLQNCSLTRELARLQTAFSLTHSECSGTDVVKLNEKIIEMEQLHAEAQSQLTDELRIAEAKLMMAEDSERVQKNRIEELQNSVADWRNRYEELGRENETLQRVNGEVHNLEIAIGEMSREKQQLYEQLCKVMEERRQLIASRDHLSMLLTESTQQNEVFEGKLQRATEARTQNAMKIIEMESEIKELKATLEEEKQQRQQNHLKKDTIAEMATTPVDGPAALVYASPIDQAEEEFRKVDLTASEKSARAATSSPGENEERIAVGVVEHADDRNSVSERLRIAFNAIRLLEEGLQVDGEEQNNDVDIRRSVQIIAASTPWPGLTERLHRYLRTLPHRRNAVRLYLRYLLIIYFILLHGAFLRCGMF